VGYADCSQRSLGFAALQCVSHLLRLQALGIVQCSLTAVVDAVASAAETAFGMGGLGIFIRTCLCCLVFWWEVWRRVRLSHTPPPDAGVVYERTMRCSFIHVLFADLRIGCGHCMQHKRA
jgi:hypothetical protein